MSNLSRPQPFVKWAGGKRQLIPALLERMPEQYGRYFEPFIGGGALFFELQPENAVINDINKVLVATYRAIQSNPSALMARIGEIDSGLGDEPKEYYYRVRDAFNERLSEGRYDLETSALFVHLNKHCFNGLYRVNAKGLFNVPYNGSKAKSFTEDSILAASEALGDTCILEGDFQDACEDAQPGDFIFFDSPYAPLNPTSFEAYTKEGFSIDEHKRLADLFRELDSLGCYCLLTNHNTELINELYKGYRIDVVQVKRFINSDASNRKGTEVIIRNY